MPDETDPLLGNTRLTRSRRTTRYLQNEIDVRHSYWVLLVCYVITGLLDSSAVLVWGSFVSMQTGNTVYFGLGLVGASDDKWIKSGVSIAGFCVGSFAFASFHRLLPDGRRWVWATSFTIQLVFIVIAASIVAVFRPSRDSPLSWPVILPLILVSAQSSGQAVASRVLKCSSLTSVVLTSIYCDFFSNLNLLVTGDVEELKRAAAIVCLLLGTILGGLWAHSPFGIMGALWTAAVLKALICFAWIGWKKKED